MIIHHYDPISGVYLGSGPADPDPLDNPQAKENLPWVIPAFATKIQPPVPTANFHRVFSNGAWGYVANNSNQEPQPQPVVTKEQVDAERDRRIVSGFVFNGVRFQSRPEDRENIMGASTAALDAKVNGVQPGDLHWHGDPQNPFAWIAEDNSIVPMDAFTVFAFGKTALAHKQAHIFAARYLKNLDPIPADYATNDIYWP